MKSELKAKFLQHLISKKRDGGFTLIELLVVIIIIGILAAIALPSFLNQANKAKQSEAKSYVGTLNRTQQAYYLEKGQFASSLDVLSNPIASQTENYTYSATVADAGTNVENVTSKADSRKAALKAYAGMAAISTTTGTSEANTVAILCEKSAIGIGSLTSVTKPASAGNPPTCGADGTSLK